MADISISVASGEYDRIRAVKDGVVKVEGCAITYRVMEANALFAHNLKTNEFDVAEMSFSTYVALRDNNRAQYTAIPVFLSRAFRHSAIFVRTDRGIASPADLKGKRIGTTEYFTTMLVWMRGLLADEYGVKPSDLRWRLGGVDQPLHEMHDPFPFGRHGASDVELEAIPAGKSLSGMLVDGEIDAIFSARPPSCFGRDPKVARLFPDYRATEQAYFRKTGIYPLMHAIGIRNSLLAQHPWLAPRLFEAYSKAKDLAVAEFEKLAAFAITLPWIEAEYRATQAVLGPDVWPYGLAPNRLVLDTLCRYLFEQGFTSRLMKTDELFAAVL